MIIPDITVDSELTQIDRVATLTFQRDDIKNTLTDSHIGQDIQNTVAWVNANRNISVLIIRGEGSCFSAGGNIKHMRDRSGDFAGDVPEVEARYRNGIQRIPLALDTLEVPTIAVINGPAIGAGCDLACMCDIRLGSDRAKFGETFVNLGIIPGDGGGWYLQRLVGYQRALEMTLTGRLVASQEAKDIGLLLDVYADETELHSEALKLANTFASKPPQALRYAKRLLKAAQRTELRDYLDMCAMTQGICHNTQDHLLAVNSFLDKQKPEFEGK